MSEHPYMNMASAFLLGYGGTMMIERLFLKPAQSGVDDKKH